MNFADRVREEARLQALVCLADAAEYTAADVLLHAALRDEGMALSVASLRVELAWLDEQGLVVTQRPGGALGVTLATLTDRGLDVALGLEMVPGVARPRPGR
jgi:repressor of nif and glnA expression